MTSTQRRLLLAAALLGLGASSVSSYVHYQLLTDPAYASFCDVNAAVSCTQAYLSQYGSFMGVPVALAGVIFFAAVLALVALGGAPGSPARDSVPGYVFALSTAGLAFVLYLAWASYFQLKIFCILCALTYAAVIALFIVSGSATSFPMTTLPRRAARDGRTLVSSPLGLVILLALVIGGGSMIGLFPREGVAAQSASAPSLPPLSDTERRQLEEWWNVQPRVELPVPADGAKVLIVKFSDYQCPGCRSAHQFYKDMLAKYTADGRVKHVLKHYPLEPECNPHSGGNHYASCEAAAAEVMARASGNHDKLTDWLFANQPSLTPDAVKRGAREVAGVQDFDAQYQKALEQVKADAGLGATVNVRSTPTLFINGRRIDGGVYPANVIEALIEIELKRAQ